MSITCKFCSKSLKLEDIPIKDYQARRVIETVGVVTVEKKGSAITDRINCGKGEDTVKADDKDKVASNCEHVTRS